MKHCFKLNHKTYSRALKAGYAMKCKGKIPPNCEYRAYYCNSCKAWHLTTKTKEQYETKLIKYVSKRFKKNA